MSRATTRRFPQVVPGFTGELIRPGDERYDAARAVWNAAIDRRPALIARAHGTTDVAAVIRHARDSGLPLSVRGGGHSAAGLAVADGALLLDLSPMRAVTVDPAVRVAVAAPGLTWTELDAATQARGLAVTGGVVGTANRDQGRLRPRQFLPHQPQHPPGGSKGIDVMTNALIAGGGIAGLAGPF